MSHLAEDSDGGGGSEVLSWFTLSVADMAPVFEGFTAVSSATYWVNAVLKSPAWERQRERGHVTVSDSFQETVTALIVCHQEL